jgi:hypothetical protein
MTTIDFEGSPTGSITGSEYAGLGVIFDSEGGSGALEHNYGGTLTENITSDDWYHPLLIDFVNPSNSGEDWIVDYVSMQNKFDEDYWVVTAYDLNGSLLDTQIVNYQEQTVVFSGIGDIHSIKLDASQTAFAMDNFTFDGLGAPGDVIPAPGAVMLGSIGAGLVSWLRRRRAI